MRSFSCCIPLKLTMLITRFVGACCVCCVAALLALHCCADGVILSSAAKLALAQGTCAPSLTVMATPNKSLLLMGIFDSTGTVTGAGSGMPALCIHACFIKNFSASHYMMHGDFEVMCLAAWLGGDNQEVQRTRERGRRAGAVFRDHLFNTFFPHSMCCAACCCAAGSVTASNVFNQPGLQATLTGTPTLAGGSATLAGASLTMDYVTPYTRLRCDPNKYGFHGIAICMVCNV